MITLEFTILIKAPREKVWQVLWNDNSYRQWTSAFAEGSYAESDWKEGSKIRFLGPNGDGMFSIIRRKKEFEEMSFEHQGEIINGKEENTNWQGATESYFLQDREGMTELNVQLQISNEFREYFETAFPKALDMVKKMAEEDLSTVR